MGHQKLVQEIPFRAHDFYAVIPRLLRPRGRGHDVGDLLLNAVLVQLLGRKRRNRRLHGRGRHAVWAIGIAPRMQDLHRDLAICVMHPVGHDLMVGDIFIGEQPRRTRKHAALAVRGHAARHHQRHAAPRTSRVELRHPVPVLGFLEPGMHRPHQHAVFQRGEPKVQRGEHMRVGGHSGLSIFAHSLPQRAGQVTQNPASERAAPSWSRRNGGGRLS